MNKTLLSLIIIAAGIVGCNTAPENTAKKSDSITASIPVTPEADTTRNKLLFNFLATGNEPFWSLEIRSDSTMIFKTPDGIEIITPVNINTQAIKEGMMQYTGTHENETLIVQVTKLECIDNMSGQKSDYQVTVDVQQKQDKASRIYNGCGRYKK